LKCGSPPAGTGGELARPVGQAWVLKGFGPEVWYAAREQAERNPLDAVADTVAGTTAEILIRKVKGGGIFASTPACNNTQTECCGIL
jgi:hypothetical protein